MIEIREDIRKLQSVLKNLVRVGVVSSINSGDCTAKVAFKEFDGGIVSYDLPIMVKQSMRNKDYWLPDINEQVICVFLPTGLEQGFILGSFYSDVDKTAVQNPDVRQVTFGDGAVFEYNRKTHALKISGLTVAEIQATNIKLDGEVEITKNLTVDKDISGKQKITAVQDVSGAEVIDSVGSMSVFRDAYNQHNHANNGASPPNPQVTGGGSGSSSSSSGGSSGGAGTITAGDGVVDNAGSSAVAMVVAQTVRIVGGQTLPLQQQPSYLIGQAQILNTSGLSEGFASGLVINNDKTINLGTADFDGYYLLLQYKY